MLNRAAILVVIPVSLSVFWSIDRGQGQIQATEPKSAELENRYNTIIEQLEDEKNKNVEELHEVYLKSQDLESRLAACLSLAVHYSEINPRLSQQYLATAMAIRDPFGDDHYLSATASFFRIKYYFNPQGAPDLVSELQKLVKDEHLPWKMLKVSFEMLLDQQWKDRDYAGFIKTFEDYEDKVPQFAIEDVNLKRICFILQVEGKTQEFIEKLEILASRFPLSEESKWAFQQLVEKHQSEDKDSFSMSLSFIRKVHLNSIIDTSSRDLILEQLNYPVRMSENSRPIHLDDYERIRILLRLKEFERSLKVIESVEKMAMNSHQEMRAGLWKAHILGELGRHDEAVKLFKGYFDNISDIGPFFLESYASNLMKNGQFKEAAEAFHKVRNSRDHYRIRWYTFWNLTKTSEKSQAASILKKGGPIFYENAESPDAKLYWSLVNDLKNQKTKLTDQEMFHGHRKYYYNFLLKARMDHETENEQDNLEEFQNLTLGFDFNHFIAKQVGMSHFQIREIPKSQNQEGKSYLYAANGLQANLQRDVDPKLIDEIDVEKNQAPQPLPYDREVRIIAKNLDLDPYLIYSLIRAESSFNPIAMSPIGARGIMQLMPYTAIKIANLAGQNDFDLDKLSDPIVSIIFGSLYFKFLYDAFDQNPFIAVAAYNAGPQAVHRWLQGCGQCRVDEFVELIPYRETRDYVKKVLNYFAEYKMERYRKEPFRGIPQLPNPEQIEISKLF